MRTLIPSSLKLGGASGSWRDHCRTEGVRTAAVFLPLSYSKIAGRLRDPLAPGSRLYKRRARCAAAARAIRSAGTASNCVRCAEVPSPSQVSVGETPNVEGPGLCSSGRRTRLIDGPSTLPVIVNDRPTTRDVQEWGGRSRTLCTSGHRVEVRPSARVSPCRRSYFRIISIAPHRELSCHRHPIAPAPS